MTDPLYRRIVLAAIVLLGVALYAHTLPFPFQFDDIHYIEANPLITTSDYLKKVWHISRIAQLDEELGLPADFTTNFILRPVSYLSFFLNYHVNGLNPAGYRAVNIAIHIVNAMLVYLFLAKAVRRLLADRFSTRFIPTATAFFFLVHPLQIQCVTYITQRFTSLVATFYLLALFLYVCALDARNPRKRIGFRCASLAVTGAGMLVKESMFTAPLMLLVLEVVLFHQPVRAAFRRAWPQLACLAIIPTLVILTEAAQSATPASVVDSLHIVDYGNYTPTQYVTTQLCVLVTYLRLLLFPYGQNVDPDYPLLASLVHPRVMLSLALILAILGVASYLFRRLREDGSGPLIFFGTVWFFLAISVSSGIVPLGDLMAEQRLYLPSVGVFLLLFTLLDAARRRWSRPSVEARMVVAVGLWGVVLCGFTTARNEVWRTRTSLWLDTVQKSPLKARAWHNLGQAYLEQARFREAASCYRKALALDAGYLLSYVGLSASYDELGMFREAVDWSRKGLLRDPANAELFHNRGIAQARLGEWQDAEKSLEKAVEIRPDNVGDRMSLAKLYYFGGRFAAALEECRVAARLAPPDAQLQQMLVDISAAGEDRR